MKTKYLICTIMLLWALQGRSQTDTIITYSGITGDSIYRITENRMEQNKFFGNSWYLAGAYNLSKQHDFSLNLGRTFGKSFCGGGGCYLEMKSWGFSYHLSTKNKAQKQYLGAFAEMANFPVPPGSARLEYIYDLSSNKHYIRPSVGISILFLDILYNYSFLIAGTENDFKHGVTFRIKKYLNSDNWQNTVAKNKYQINNN